MMFYHGINGEYVFQYFPILSPRRSVWGKSPEQLADRRHLIRQFGLEPIHLLEDSPDYPQSRCLEACLRFGDTVFGFSTLEDPLWQLSQHEVAVPVLDLRDARMIFTRTKDAKRLSSLFPNIPIRFLEKYGE